MAKRTVFAGIETGGTKVLARVEDAGGAALAEGRWPTTTPDTAIEALTGFIRDAVPAGAMLAGVGLASFGPIILDPAAADAGRMLDTPKPGWTGSNLRLALAQALGAPVMVDTDVNAAAVAEATLGAGRGLASVAYVTVGTGIGAGLARDGRALTGALHPEAGHLRVIRAAGDAMPSACPFHADCAEGLAAGPAVARRLAGRALEAAPEVLAIVADYLGQLAGALVLAWSPHRIVWGGGVMHTPGLLDAVRRSLAATLGGYGVGPTAATPDFLAPALLENAGLEGALLMARRLSSERR